MSLKLFKLYSIVDDFLGRDDVRLTWFIPARKTRLALDYEQLIESFDQAYYDQLNLDHDSGIGILDKEIGFLQGSDCAINFINEHFTATEVSQLQSYLQEAYEIDCVAEAANLPITLQILPSADLATGEGYGFFKLPQEDKAGYTLPFVVWGYYDLRLNPLTVSASISPELEAGLVFLETALQKLNYPVPEKTQLARLVAQLTAETGVVTERKFATAASQNSAPTAASGDFLDDIISRYTIAYEEDEDEDETEDETSQSRYKV